MDDIEKSLEKAKNRPPTAENLNYLGDLYFRSGNKLKAISCYYDAIDKLHYGQKEKQIAIYKKIIRNFPKDVEAYEGIAALYKRIGLVSEEIEYLTILAHIYQNQGNYNRALSAAKRISDLDPENPFALKLLKTEEDIYIEKKTRIETTKGEIPFSEPQRTITSSSIPEDTGPAEASEEEPDAEDSEITYSVKERSDKGLFTATLEEVIEEKKPDFVFEPPKSNLRLYIFSGVILLFIVAAAVFLFRGKSRDLATGITEGNALQEKLWLDNNIKSSTDKFELNLTKITEKMLADSGLTDAISQNDIARAQFYSLSIKALNGCLPDGFTSSPQRQISLIDKNGSLHILQPLDGITTLNSFIYRANTCNQDFGAVFARIFVYHMKDASFSGISVKGLEGDLPLIVKWK